MAARMAELQGFDLTEDSKHPAEQRLDELIKEFWSLMALLLLSRPDTFKDVQNCKTDEGVVCPDAQPPSFYCEVMVC